MSDAASPSAPAKKSRAWIWNLIFVVLLAGVGFAIYRFYPQINNALFSAPEKKAKQERSAPVSVAKTKQGDLPIYLNAPGTVIAKNFVTVRTRVDGEVMKINFTEGQEVKAGDLLALIDTRPYDVQLTLAQGQLAKDEASLKNAKLDLARYQAAGKAATQQQVDTAASAVGEFEGAIKIDHGQIDSAKLQLTYCHIIAPIDGKIGLRLVDQGNMVHTSDANGMAVITQVEPITVVFSLSEDNLPAILKAHGVDPNLPVEIWNRDRSAKLAQGALLAVDSQIDLVTLTAKLKAEFDNKDRALFPNQAVNVRLLVDTKKNAVLVPAIAIQHSPQGTFVYVLKDDKTADMRPITEGPREADNVVVTEGLNEDETVITEGVDKLEPGMAVTLPGEGGHKKKGEKGEGGNVGDTGENSDNADKGADDAQQSGGEEKTSGDRAVSGPHHGGGGGHRGKPKDSQDQPNESQDQPKHPKDGKEQKEQKDQ